MAKEQKHLRVDIFSKSDTYRSKKTARNPEIPLRDRREHGDYIRNAYFQAIKERDYRLPKDYQSISQETGIYLELTSYKNVQFPLSSLDDSRGYKLKSMHVVDEREITDCP